MKLSRLFAYAAVGMIVGLLIENQSMIIKAKAKARALKLKEDAADMLPTEG